MLCLSVKQPYAELIAIGRKRYELRSWTTRHRGPLVICAGKRPAVRLNSDLPLGVAVCVVDLIDIVPFTPAMANDAAAEWRAGLFAWVLENPTPTQHIPVSGKLGIFTADLLLNPA